MTKADIGPLGSSVGCSRNTGTYSFELGCTELLAPPCEGACDGSSMCKMSSLLTWRYPWDGKVKGTRASVVSGTSVTEDDLVLSWDPANDRPENWRPILFLLNYNGTIIWRDQSLPDKIWPFLASRAPKEQRESNILENSFFRECKSYTHYKRKG